jgi:two-component system OmpR family response regulator
LSSPNPNTRPGARNSGKEEVMANIIVIDDEPIVLELVLATLKNAGHSVTALNGPLDVFELPAATLKSTDLLLTDVSLKPISGFEVVRRLTLQDIHPKALFMSGYSGVASAISDQYGENSVIEKPFTLAQLRTAVDKLLGGNKHHACSL